MDRLRTKIYVNELFSMLNQEKKKKKKALLQLSVSRSVLNFIYKKKN